MTVEKGRVEKSGAAVGGRGGVIKMRGGVGNDDGMPTVC